MNTQTFNNLCRIRDGLANSTQALSTRDIHRGARLTTAICNTFRKSLRRYSTRCTCRSDWHKKTHSMRLAWCSMAQPLLNPPNTRLSILKRFYKLQLSEKIMFSKKGSRDRRRLNNISRVLYKPSNVKWITWMEQLRKRQSLMFGDPTCEHTMLPHPEDNKMYCAGCGGWAITA